MGSSRFPGKPLVSIAGLPMVVRTLERARLADCFDRILCATDSSQIAEVVSKAGFESVHTADYPTGSDRVACVAALLHLPLVVNLQGDEPVANPVLLRQVAEALSRDPGSWVTAASPLKMSEVANPNLVKVLIQDGFAKNFTRQAVSGSDWRVHRGIYGYSLDALREFAQTSSPPQELQESIEPLRILNSRPIRILTTTSVSLSVDVPGDIAAVESHLARLS